MRALILVGVCLAVLVLAAVAVSLRSPCPAGAVAVKSGGEVAFCIDQFEQSRSNGQFVSQRGKAPAELVSWTDAMEICRSKGGWLCTSAQWEDACDGEVGPGGTQYPYGDTFVEGRCTTRTAKGGGPLPAGSSEGCVSAFGAYDMVGNVWEWTDPQKQTPAGIPLTDKKGGAHYIKEPHRSRCSERNYSHPPDFKGSISFRCCYEEASGW